MELAKTRNGGQTLGDVYTRRDTFAVPRRIVPHLLSPDRGAAGVDRYGRATPAPAQPVSGISTLLRAYLLFLLKVWPRFNHKRLDD